jgi:predicted AAA+ superfamily ATPase
LFPRHKYCSLEDPDHRAFATEDPRGFLDQWGERVIFDEFQRAPALASYLQGRVDANPAPGAYILSGSQQYSLMRGVSQSLAGRTALVTLLPLTLAETCTLRPEFTAASLDETLFTGFYPRIHHRQLPPSDVLGDYFATYVERDLRELSAVHDLTQFERFIRLCAGRVGQLLNLSSLGNDAGISQPTARAWIDLLQTSHIIQLLQPWFISTTKRLVKSPKLYFCDTGLLCWLLGLRSAGQVRRDPAFGHIFENFVVMEAIKDQALRGDRWPISFYRDAKGSEIDLVIEAGAELSLLEIKAGATVHSDFFKGLRAFRRDHEGTLQGKVLNPGVVFGGEQGQMRSEASIWSWTALRNPPLAAHDLDPA